MSKQSRLNKEKAEKAKADQDKRPPQPNQKQEAQDNAQGREEGAARKSDKGS